MSSFLNVGSVDDEAHAHAPAHAQSVLYNNNCLFESGGWGGVGLVSLLLYCIVL